MKRNTTLGAFAFAAMVIGTTGLFVSGCERNTSTEEAVEEIQDEMDDAKDAVERKAKDAKEEIEDEIDDAN